MPFDLLAAARDLIRLNTGPPHSTVEAVRFLAALGRQIGLDLAVHEEIRDGIAQQNIVLRAPDGTQRNAKPLLLMNTHLDTVPPGPAEEWTATGGDPFRMTQTNGFIYGLGAADVKIDFLCKLAALGRCVASGAKPHAVLAGTYGEETGRYGAKLLTRALQPLPEAALVGEPSELRPVTSHKGYLEARFTAHDPNPSPAGAPFWDLRFSGRPAHSSQPHLGRSAIDMCLTALAGCDPVPVVTRVEGGDVVNRVAQSCRALVASAERPSVATADVRPITDLTQGDSHHSPLLLKLLLRLHGSVRALERRLERHSDPCFDPPWTSVNAGLVSLTPRRLMYALDIRRIPGERPARLVQQFLRAPVTTTAWDQTLEVVTSLDSEPFATRTSSPLLEALQEELTARGLASSPTAKSGTTEASVYHEAGMDAVVFGPGAAAGNIHRPNERVATSDVFRATEIYEGVLRRFTCH